MRRRGWSLCRGLSALCFFLWSAEYALAQDAADMTGPPDLVAVTDTLDRSVRVVIIDPGHGGNDPGTTGISGVKEKDVALQISRKIAAVLSRDPLLEVHMIRNSDHYVAPWRRGEIATELKGQRYGLFVSIHANAMPNDSVTAGAEVYFLSEARTEHERRVAAVENAPPPTEGVTHYVADESELDGILRELMSLDGHRWSSVLAESLSKGLDDVPTLRNHGVRQAPLAVITNTLMPGVLVELGYLTNRTEERRLGQAAHQQALADGIAAGIYDFLDHYPPGETLGRGAGVRSRVTNTPVGEGR